MQNKRGQVYIISAIIIILIIIGLAGLTNRATYTQEPSKFYELGQQLSGEIFVLAAYGEYNPQEGGAQEVINNFTQGPFLTYVQSTGTEFLVVYGNKTSITQTTCVYGEGGVSIGETDVSQGELECDETESSSGTYETIEFQGQSYPISLNQNQGYYYIFTTQQGEDTFTYTQESE